MPALARATNAAETTFGVLTALTGIYAFYKWLYFLFVWRDAWAMSEALTWTLIATLFVAPVLAIDYVRGD